MMNRQKGFTFIEVLLTAAISTIIFVGAFGILRASNKQMEVIHAKMTLEEVPREALLKMAQELRQTSWHKIDSLGTPGADGYVRANAITFVVPVPNPDEATLVDANYTPKWACQIQYRLDENTHQILRVATDLPTEEVPTPPPAKTAVLANEVRSLEFSSPSTLPGLITITATAQRTLLDGTTVPNTPLQLIAQAEARNP